MPLQAHASVENDLLPGAVGVETAIVSWVAPSSDPPKRQRKKKRPKNRDAGSAKAGTRKDDGGDGDDADQEPINHAVGLLEYDAENADGMD